MACSLIFRLESHLVQCTFGEAAFEDLSRVVSKLYYKCVDNRSIVRFR